MVSTFCVFVPLIRPLCRVPLLKVADLQGKGHYLFLHETVFRAFRLDTWHLRTQEAASSPATSGFAHEFYTPLDDVTFQGRNLAIHSHIMVCSHQVLVN